MGIVLVAAGVTFTSDLVKHRGFQSAPRLMPHAYGSWAAVRPTVTPAEHLERTRALKAEVDSLTEKIE